MGPILKISVLASGDVLLDGAPVTLDDLSLSLGRAPEDAVIWYYRENAGGDAPAIVQQVMQLITARCLPIRLSTKPDFSDSVAPAIERMFAHVRKQAAERNIAIVRPDGRTMLLPALDRNAAPPDAIASVEAMLPSAVPRRIAAIADTAWAQTASPAMKDADKAVPFFGILMGFAAIGHTVWLFHGGPLDTIAAGCRDAEVAIVDSARLSTLPEGWAASAAGAMRNPQILVFDRATRQLRQVG